MLQAKCPASLSLSRWQRTDSAPGTITILTRLCLPALFAPHSASPLYFISDKADSLAFQHWKPQFQTHLFLKRQAVYLQLHLRVIQKLGAQEPAWVNNMQRTWAETFWFKSRSDWGLQFFRRTQQSFHIIALCAPCFPLPFSVTTSFTVTVCWLDCAAVTEVRKLRVEKERNGNKDQLKRLTLCPFTPDSLPTEF